MGKVCESIVVDNLKISGMPGDYVFETIRKQQNYYEIELLETWTPYVKDAKYILDVGANLGNHTLYWSKYAGAKTIYSFEPYHINFDLLTENVKNNGLHNVVLVNKAVGAQKGHTTVNQVDEKNYGGTILSQEITEDGDIEITDIDSFCEDMNVTEIDFIKIDTEGYEEKVLAGTLKTIEKCCPDFWVEVNSSTATGVAKFLRDRGYCLVAIKGCNFLFLHPKRHDDISEIPNSEIIGMMVGNLERVNKYYKNYETAKKWHQNSLDKNSRLEKELSEKQKACEQAKEMLSMKEMECRAAEEKYHQQKELLEGVKSLGNQRENLISEYIVWNEQNKQRILELESRAGEMALFLEAERDKWEKQQAVLQKEIGEKQEYIAKLENCTIELNDFKQVVERKEAENQELQICIQQESGQKEKYNIELELCRSELLNTQSILEEKGKENQELLGRLGYETGQKERYVSELENCLAELEKAKQKAEQKAVENQELQGRLGYETGQRERYVSELESCSKTLVEVQQEVKRKIIENQNLRNSLEVETEQKEEYASKLEECSKALLKKRQETEQCHSDMEAIKKSLEKKIEALEITKEALVQESARKEKCVAELQACLKELEDKEQLLEEYKDCQITMTELEQQMEAGKVKQKQLEEIISELQAKIEADKGNQEQLEMSVSELQTRIDADTVKKKQLERIILELKQQIESGNANQKQMKQELCECVAELQEQEAFLSELCQYIRRLETQNRYLTSENAECKRKLSIITDTKWGQFGIKVYHILKKIYKKICGKK